MTRVFVSDEQLVEAVRNSVSYAGVIRLLGKRQAGGTQSHYKRRIESLGLDTSHFTGQGHNAGEISRTRRSSDSILIERASGYRQKASLLRRALIDCGVEYVCSSCGNGPDWMGNRLVLDVDHINENWLDDRLDNLRFLCPNCHSQFSRNLLDN